MATERTACLFYQSRRAHEWLACYHSSDIADIESSSHEGPGKGKQTNRQCRSRRRRNPV